MEHTLLFVDDGQNVLNSLERLFEDEGYEILTASSGNEALQKLKVSGPIRYLIRRLFTRIMER